jgi:hypothetical protein
MNKDSKVGIAILTLNQKEKTLRCLRSFSEVKYAEHKIFLLDNGSADNTFDYVNKEFPEVITYYSPQNLGVAIGRNFAAQKIKVNYNPAFLLFIDNDTTVEADFLEKLMAVIQKDATIAIVTPKIKFFNKPDILYGAGGVEVKFWLGKTMHRGYKQFDNGKFEKSIDCISSGGCMLVRTDTFFELNGFDPVFNPYGPEDLDFVYRLKKRNLRSVYVPQAVIYHDPDPGHTFTGGKVNETYMKLKTRNWMIFLKKHSPVSQKFLFIFVTSPVNFVIIVIREIFKGNFSAVWGMFLGLLEFLKIKKIS